MRTRFLPFAALAFALLNPVLARADLCVIVHPDNPVLAMTPSQISDLYLGRARGFDNNGLTNSARATLYEQPENSPLREAFFRSINGMSLNHVTAYWARLRFSGQVLPPEMLADSRAILEKVNTNRNAIGYIESDLVDRSVKVVLRLKQ
jgi:ABC-type phosphate transport system substrate-binding protein